MSLTEEQKKKYLEEGAQHCPYCGSDDIEAGPYEADWMEAWSKVSCHTCDQEWLDLFKLVGVE